MSLHVCTELRTTFSACEAPFTTAIPGQWDPPPLLSAQDQLFSNLLEHVVGEDIQKSRAQELIEDNYTTPT